MFFIPKTLRREQKQKSRSVRQSCSFPVVRMFYQPDSKYEPYELGNVVTCRKAGASTLWLRLEPSSIMASYLEGYPSFLRSSSRSLDCNKHFHSLYIIQCKCFIYYFKRKNRRSSSDIVRLTMDTLYDSNCQQMDSLLLPDIYHST